MKNIFPTFVLCLLGTSLFGAQSNKRIAINPELSVTGSRVIGFSGFNYMPDEITVVLAKFLINPETPFKSAQDLVSFKRACSSFHAIAQDSTLDKQISKDLVITALTRPQFLPEIIKDLHEIKKLMILNRVQQIPSTDAQICICKQLEAVRPKLFSKSLKHSIIDQAIYDSDLQLFEPCQKILNLFNPDDQGATFTLRLSAEHIFRKKKRICIKQQFPHIMNHHRIKPSRESQLLSNSQIILQKLSPR